MAKRMGHRGEPAGRRGGAVETAADVRRIVADTIENLMADADLDPLQRGRVVARLAGVQLQAIELANLDARLTAIEAVLKVRNDIQKEEEKR